MKAFIAAILAAFVAVSSAGSIGKASQEYAPYTVVGTFENNIEERLYPAQKWSTVEEVATPNNMDKLKGEQFMTLFNYITGKNDQSAEIPMTRPVSTRVVSDEAGNMSYEMGFYIPEAFQTNTPQPTDEKVKIVERDLHVYSISFPGFPREAEYDAKLAELTSFLSSKGVQVPTAEGSADPIRYFVAYNSPFEIINRKNEVWVQV